jgi:hypothetical protein
MSNQEEYRSILKALTELQGNGHPLPLAILAEMEIMRHVEMQRSLAEGEIDDAALHDLHTRIADHVVSGVHGILSTGAHKEMRTGPAAQGRSMLPGEVLNPGSALHNGQFKFTYHQDGDLRLDEIHKNPIYWSSGTQGRGAGVCILEEDGNLVIYDSDDNPIWMTGTWGHPDSQLTIKDDGYVVIERPAQLGLAFHHIPVWSTSWLLGSLRVFHARGSTAPHPETTLTVPEGWKILGGGARVNWSEPGNWLTASFPKDVRTWVAKATEHMQSSPANIDVWVIAIADRDNQCDVRISSQVGAAGLIPSAIATVPGNYVLTGGGAQANWKSEGSLLKASYPASPNSWVGVSKNPTGGEPATVTAYAIGIRDSDTAPVFLKAIFEREMFETKVLATTGTSAGRPSAEMSTRGGYVLIGGGAVVNGMGNNFLTASYPEANTWKAASKEHLESGACTITAYAIGARVGSGTLFRPLG